MTRAYAPMVVCLAFVLSACVAAKEFHPDDPVTRLRVDPAKPADDAISLAYVEFDDNGELFDRNQVDAAVHRIQNVRAMATRGVDVVVFIHGWKNDANNSGNVSGFQRFLREVSSIRNPLAPNGARRPLVGVYMAWRGAAVKLGQNLTYWNRSLATTRVAGPHFEEALIRITRAAKDVGPRGASEDNSLVVIGHSFGGRVLEHALTPYFETLLLQASGVNFGPCTTANSGPGTQVKGPWPDLTVLLNEAAPATDAKAILESLTCHGVTYERAGVAVPLIVSFTSDGDSATGVALPGGQLLAGTQLQRRGYPAPKPDRPWEGPAEITNQTTYYTHSAAHIPALHSHVLMRIDRNAPACAAPVVLDPAKGPTIVVRRDRLRAHGQQRDPDTTYEYQLCTVGTTHDPKAPAPYWNHTPYWIFKIPIEIVPNHSDIFRRETFDLLTFFLPPSGVQGVLTVR